MPSRWALNFFSTLSGLLLKNWEVHNYYITVKGLQSWTTKPSYNLLGRKIGLESFILKISCSPCLLISLPAHQKNWSNQLKVISWCFFLVEIILGNQMTSLCGFCVDFSYHSIWKLHFTLTVDVLKNKNRLTVTIFDLGRIISPWPWRYNLNINTQKILERENCIFDLLASQVFYLFLLKIKESALPRFKLRQSQFEIQVLSIS